jgi:DNA-binding NtrC family response regulator
VLEDRQLTRLGGERPIAMTARVVAATNRDLEHEVADRRFREDLYYRLNVHVLRVPPLRERLADLPLLVDHLLRTIASQLRLRAKTITPEAVRQLAAHDWRRNNVRELRNCLERMVIASDDETLGVEDVPAEIRGPARDESRHDEGDVAGEPGSFKALKAQAERQIVVAALDAHGWQITRAAEALGLSDHASLLKIMRRHGLSRSGARDH